MITGVGAHCLMEAVKDNNTLARLKVFRNKLTNKERVEFVKCMMKYLQPPPPPPSTEGNLAEQLAQNMLKHGTFAVKGGMALGLKGAKASLTAGLKGAKMGMKAGKAGMAMGINAGKAVVKKGSSVVKITPKKKK